LGSTQPPIQLVPETFFPGIMRPERETNHSPPPSSDVKNSWNCNSTHPIRLQLKHRNNELKLNSVTMNLV